MLIHVCACVQRKCVAAGAAWVVFLGASGLVGFELADGVRAIARARGENKKRAAERINRAVAAVESHEEEMRSVREEMKRLQADNAQLRDLLQKRQ